MLVLGFPGLFLYVLQSEKVGRPRTRDLCNLKSANLENKESKVSQDEQDPIQRWR